MNKNQSTEADKQNSLEEALQYYEDQPKGVFKSIGLLYAKTIRRKLGTHIAHWIIHTLYFIWFDSHEDNLEGPYLTGSQFTLAEVSALPFFERLIFSCRKFKSFEIPHLGRFGRDVMFECRNW